MTQYRKKPVVIEAFQLPALDESAEAFTEWAALVEFDGYTSEREGCMTIETLEGTMTAEPRDWIIKGIDGEFYPCKPHIFAATYEVADAPPDVSNVGKVPVPAPDTTFYAGFEGDRVKYHSVDQLCEFANARVAAALSVRSGDGSRPTLPATVIDALRFYAHGHHFNIDDDHQQFDTISGEPQNWLFSERDDDRTMIEDGSVAKAVLLGGLPGFEEPTEPLEGEVFAATSSAGDQEVGQ